MKALRVLVVEDNATIGMLLGEMRAEMGHHVCGVEATEAEAVACKMRSERYMTGANSPSTNKLRPNRKPIKFPIVLHLPSETSDPMS